jgi:hypothetical protein
LQRLLASGADEQARLLLALGHPARALPFGRSGLEQFETLSAVDRSNLEWLDQVVFARLHVAEIEIALGHRDAAQIELDRAAADMAGLVPAGKPRSRRNLVTALQLLCLRADVAMGGGPPVPTQPLGAAVAQLLDAGSSGAQLNPVQERLASAGMLRFGDLLWMENRRDEATAQWRTAAERLRSVAKDNLPALTVLARLEIRLGRVEAAREIASRIQASSYRHPDHAALVKELADETGTRRHNNQRKH